ncbi:hypothetical protein AQ490_19105 [Wenjunlia vitaminophila]|uniref:N-acetyltransferase domain-containing protein n=1 Tax=Wenjunlia vitaminophila TaxID=76728 RepID=A0A0T6LUN2_WENVI|nr:GNAT family N-acetyltransferase [Wenjunlia vitaminophila]KRV49803.1 hypothetical protein AQ490_19105 [Wenjunlia vitaminophila]
MTDKRSRTRTRSASGHRWPASAEDFDRAWTLMNLDARLGTWAPSGAPAAPSPGVEEVTVHQAGPEALAAAVALHQRCSPGTLRRRYPGPTHDVDRYLPHLLDPRHGHTLAARAADGRMVAVAHLLWDAPDAEVALLVADAWQGRGIGRALLRRLVDLAVDARAASVYAVTQADNTGVVAVMRHLGLPLEHRVEQGTLTVTARLAPSWRPSPARPGQG